MLYQRILRVLGKLSWNQHGLVYSSLRAQAVSSPLGRCFFLHFAVLPYGNFVHALNFPLELRGQLCFVAVQFLLDMFTWTRPACCLASSSAMRAAASRVCLATHQHLFFSSKAVIGMYPHQLAEQFCHQLAGQTMVLFLQIVLSVAIPLLTTYWYEARLITSFFRSRQVDVRLSSSQLQAMQHERPWLLLYLSLVTSAAVAQLLSMALPVNEQMCRPYAHLQMSC